MRVQIVARQCEVPPAARERAEEQMKKLSRYDSTLSSAEIIFSEERHLRQVEAILMLDGEGPAVAKGEGDDFRSAVDRSAERLSKILRRRRDQLLDHQGPRTSEIVGTRD